jgi:PTS system fructose-specific IIC component
MKIVAVTSCPTGIAHTYMAAEALERAAKKAGHEITVETQGAGGKKEIPADILQAADVAIFAADVPVRDKDRFAHLPIIEAQVKTAIREASKLIEEAEAKVSAKG